MCTFCIHVPVSNFIFFLDFFLTQVQCTTRIQLKEEKHLFTSYSNELAA